MKLESSTAGNITETAAEEERPFRSSGNLMNVVADKLRSIAKTISRRAAAEESKPEVAYYGEQASAMLEQSADYVRELDYKTVEASVRKYVKENPGRSLLMAGLSGLVIGAILRRR